MSCVICDPSLKPTRPRQGKHHFGAHLGDDCARLRAVLDGVVQWNAVEIWEGEDGEAIVMEAGACECGSGKLAFRRVKGNWSVLRALFTQTGR